MINSASVLDIYRAVRDGLINIEQLLVGSDYPFNKAIGTLDVCRGFETRNQRRVWTKMLF